MKLNEFWYCGLDPGGDDGTIKIFSRETVQLVGTLTGHVGPVTALKMNPAYLMMGSACENVVMWIPSEDSGGGASSTSS